MSAGWKSLGISGKDVAERFQAPCEPSTRLSWRSLSLQAFCDSAEEERQCQLYKEKALVRHWSNLWSGMEIQDTRMNSLKKSCNFITLATFSVIRQCQYSYMRVSLKSEIHALMLLLFHLKCHLYFQDPFQGVNVSERSRLDDTVVHRSQYNSFKEEQPLLSLG